MYDKTDNIKRLWVRDDGIYIQHVSMSVGYKIARNSHTNVSSIHAMALFAAANKLQLRIVTTSSSNKYIDSVEIIF